MRGRVYLYKRGLESEALRSVIYTKCKFYLCITSSIEFRSCSLENEFSNFFLFVFQFSSFHPLFKVNLTELMGMLNYFDCFEDYIQHITVELNITFKNSNRY